MKITRRKAMAGVGAVLALGGGARAQTGGGWIRRADLPWTAQEIYPCVWRGGILVAGGLRGGSAGFEAIDRVAFYDPAEDAWAPCAPLPAPRHHGMLVPVGDRVMVIGGFVPVNESFWRNDPSVLLYDPEGGAEPAPDLPAPQSESVAALIGGRIHLVTGRTLREQANGRFEDQMDIATHLTCDPATGVWEAARPALTARNSAAGGVIDGALHVVGGRTMAGGNLAVHERYDPAADRWDELAPMPQAQGGLAAAVLDGKLYAFGGEYFNQRGAGVYAACWIYDPAADVWSAGPDMDRPRHGLGGLTLDGRVYAIGGALGPSGSGTSAVLDVLERA